LRVGRILEVEKALRLRPALRGRKQNLDRELLRAVERIHGHEHAIMRAVEHRRAVLQLRRAPSTSVIISPTFFGIPS